MAALAKTEAAEKAEKIRKEVERRRKVEEKRKVEEEEKKAADGAARAAKRKTSRPIVPDSESEEISDLDKNPSSTKSCMACIKRGCKCVIVNVSFVVIPSPFLG